MITAELDPQYQSKVMEALFSDEQLQWVGRSQPFPLVCKENRSALLLRWTICTVCAIVLSIIYAVWTNSSGSNYSIIMELVIIVAFVYSAILVPVLNRHSLMTKTLYCITNKRIMVFVADRPVIALNRTGLKSRCIARENGCIHVLFGASVDTKPHRYRLTTIAPQIDESSEVPVGAIFYNVKKDSVPTDIFTFS